MATHRGLETLAIAGHGGSVVLHVLAAVWHRVTAERWDVWSKIHGAIAIGSAVSLIVHATRNLHNK